MANVLLAGNPMSVVTMQNIYSGQCIKIFAIILQVFHPPSPPETMCIGLYWSTTRRTVMSPKDREN